MTMRMGSSGVGFAWTKPRDLYFATTVPVRSKKFSALASQSESSFPAAVNEIERAAFQQVVVGMKLEYVHVADAPAGAPTMLPDPPWPTEATCATASPSGAEAAPAFDSRK